MYQGRVNATFVKGSWALHGSAGPLKESANLRMSISGLCWFESAGDTRKTSSEEPEEPKQPWG